MEHPGELAVELPFNVSNDEARLALAVRLFEKGRISLGQAAKLADFSKRAFIDMLGREGVPVVNYPAGEFGSAFSWLKVRPPADANYVAALKLQLDDGEAEAIALAKELNAVVVLDDLPARRAAKM